ncbi:DUF4240 domain-containing protein [Streptomyces sp. NPDC047082]|uniref:DUF4240 domain-containing protein n=1 Tax=Streptomyces sp. NPDC047082 TaxID=3155259 RepID=UPI0033F2A3A2
MDTEAFWRLLGTAEDSGEPLDDAVAAQLAAMPAEEILAFEHRFTQLRHAIHRWDVWAAAYLIGGGCSDDRFCDFTAGLVALGPHWYNRANACPDELAEHPAVQAAAATGDQEAVFAEDFSFVSCRAYAQLTGNEDGFWEAWETAAARTPRTRRTETRAWASRSISTTPTRCAGDCRGWPPSTPPPADPPPVHRLDLLQNMLRIESGSRASRRAHRAVSLSPTTETAQRSANLRIAPCPEENPACDTCLLISSPTRARACRWRVPGGFHLLSGSLDLRIVQVERAALHWPL